MDCFEEVTRLGFWVGFGVSILVLVLAFVELNLLIVCKGVLNAFDRGEMNLGDDDEGIKIDPLR